MTIFLIQVLRYWDIISSKDENETKKMGICWTTPTNII
jgi:hypothetical protein